MEIQAQVSYANQLILWMLTKFYSDHYVRHLVQLSYYVPVLCPIVSMKNAQNMGSQLTWF